MQDISSVALWEDLHDMLRAMRQAMMARLSADHPAMSFWDMRVIMIVGEEPGITQKDLIARSHMDKAQMARLLAHVEAQGWLERAPSAQDKRVRSLQLNEAGQQLYLQLKACRDQLASEYFGHWTPEARQLIREAVQQSRPLAG